MRVCAGRETIWNNVIFSHFHQFIHDAKENVAGKKVAGWRLEQQWSSLLQSVHKLKYTNYFGPEPRDTGTQPVRSDELLRWHGFRDMMGFQATWKVTAVRMPELSKSSPGSSGRRGLSERTTGFPTCSSLMRPGSHMRRGTRWVPCTQPCVHPTALGLNIWKHWRSLSATLQDSNRIKSGNFLPNVQVLSSYYYPTPQSTLCEKIIFLIVND